MTDVFPEAKETSFCFSLLSIEINLIYAGEKMTSAKPPLQALATQLVQTKKNIVIMFYKKIPVSFNGN